MLLILQAAQFVATLGCAVFAGAAIYISAVEHPARMRFDTKTAAALWAPSYQRATLMQAPLAVASALAGVAAWLLGGGAAWRAGAVLIGGVVPFTLIVIKPTNARLLAPGRDLASQETRSLLDKWGKLHAVRTGASAVASVIFVAALLRG
ncbi:Protein of unknown function DUF1772 [Caballeronia glathei]|uniref:DUF1772 domain-containing protein n=1 Tax=Caballeronia glathei TaxID=60547 RepID=A0A069PS14_9BURK|nr:DUF1772 domain-containing protein [Caballeronia glathei]KDR43212.1 hypothetical protein BG61_40255 [Caballeronia glathei]CDY79304.1 Protein of unknown function DUF1772 [Caballeronia glathei]